jgi:hypothetical protein
MVDIFPYKSDIQIYLPNLISIFVARQFKTVLSIINAQHFITVLDHNYLISCKENPQGAMQNCKKMTLKFCKLGIMHKSLTCLILIIRSFYTYLFYHNLFVKNIQVSIYWQSVKYLPLAIYKHTHRKTYGKDYHTHK